MSKLFTAALGLAVAVLPVLGVGFAAADDDLSCDAAKSAIVKLEKKLDEAVFDERSKEQPVLDEAKRVRDAAKAALDLLKNDAVDDAEQKAAIDDARGVLDAAKAELARAQKKFDTDSSKVAGLRAQVEVAVADRDKACAEPTTTPTTPAPTTTPAPAPEFPVDLDCADLSDQEAQKVLDADKADPHDLDSDEDGLACDELDNPVSNDTVVVPSGGVNTGGGPA